jgi:hypothetical protein
MRIVMTIRTRDDRDLVDAQLAFHFAAGVDFVIANDHRSVDGTRDVLAEYERRGVLHLIRRDAERFVPGEWVDEMARLAATEFEADWVFHTDADEFWWPRGEHRRRAGDRSPSVRRRPGALASLRGSTR